MLDKVVEIFKKIPNAYYNWKSRNEKLSTFLDNCHHNQTRIEHIDQTVTTLQADIANVKQKVNSLEQQINQVNGRLESISAGTKTELFDTLHRWRVRLVVQRQWASPAEKREVEEIYHIYHDELKGNGQGERYYKEIMDLPESEEEKDARG